MGTDQFTFYLDMTPIEQAIQQVTEAILSGVLENTPTGIRCAINDSLDAMSRSGEVVEDDEDGFGYDQEGAIREIREAIGKTDFRDQKRTGE